MSARRTVTIRRSLLVNVVLVVVLLGAAIVGTSYLGSKRAVTRFSKSLLDQTLHRVEVELEGFLLPLERRLLTLRRWGETGVLDLDDPERLDRLLQPVMRAVPWISSVMIADEGGREQMLLRDGPSWRSRQTRRDEWGGEVLWREWSDGDPAVAERTEQLDYDPRTRPWYTGAVNGIFWTEPYAFFTTGDPGITAAVPFYDPKGRRSVIAVDVTLFTVSRLTSRIEVHHNGVAFVLSDDGRLIGSPRVKGLIDEAEIRRDLLRRPDEFDSPLARAVAEVLVAREDRFGQATRFRDEGEAWWGLVKPFPLGRERELLIGIGVPESDLLGDLNRQRLWMGLITLAVLGLALARAWVLATRYSRPVEQLVEESKRIATGDLDPGPAIETDVAEVHALAEAHDRMREGLKNLLRIERDLDLARRIQQSTFPKRLPDLEGYDLAAWNEPADQTGGDTYDVIGLDDDRAVLLLADATGHGIGPALSVTQVRAMLRMAVRISPDLSRIGTHMNQQLCCRPAPRPLHHRLARPARPVRRHVDNALRGAGASAALPGGNEQFRTTWSRHDALRPFRQRRDRGLHDAAPTAGRHLRCDLRRHLRVGGARRGGFRRRENRGDHPPAPG